MSDLFTAVILICIGINTVVLSLDRHPITIEDAAQLEYINSIMTWIFVGELLIKVLGLGIKTYVIDPVN